MVRIGGDLRRRGNEVTVLTGTEYAPAIDAASLRAAPVTGWARLDPPHLPRLAAHLPAILRRLIAGRSELQSVFIAPLLDQYKAMRQSLADETFDVILADIAFTGVLPLLLADGPRPPIVLCGLGPLTLSSVDAPPFGMAWQPEPGMDYRRMTSFAHGVLFGDVQARFDRTLRSACGKTAPVFVTDWVGLADAVLQLSVPGFEYPRSDLPKNVSYMGPVLPKAAPVGELPTWWDEVVEAPFVVHVTQGTYDNVDLDQLIGPTLAGLADRDDVLVVATTAGRHARSLSASIPRNARVADWLPYSILMPHVDVMVTNGGYGGVQHALSEAVPLVVAGETSDKAEIAARVEYCGAGIDLGTATPSAARVAGAVDRLRRNADHRLAANRLRDEMADTNALDSIARELARLHADASSDVTIA